MSTTQDLQRVSSTFLGSIAPRVPYVIGVAGSVAVGKFDVRAHPAGAAARWPAHPQVDLVTTDGFLHPNAVLLDRGILDRKGFPESYDSARLLRSCGRSRAASRRSALRSTTTLPTTFSRCRVVVRSPDVVIVEGLNVLQVDRDGVEFVSDYFDFSIYIDADVKDIEEWYVRASSRCASRCSAIPTATSGISPRSTTSRPHHGAPHLVDDQRPQPAREHRADARAGEPHHPQGQRSPRDRGPAAATVTAWGGRQVSSQPTSSRIDVSSANSPSCSSTTSCAHVTWYGTCTPWPPNSRIGRMSDLTELPTIRNRARIDAPLVEHVAIRGDVLLEHDSDVLEVVLDPGRAHLACLVHEIALRDEHQPMTASDGGQCLRHAVEHLDRMASSISWAWSTSSPITERRNATSGGRGDRGLHHRERVPLDAVSRHGDVVELGGVQRARVRRSPPRAGADLGDEELLGDGEVVLALPQRVVGIEPDRVELLSGAMQAASYRRARSQAGERRSRRARKAEPQDLGGIVWTTPCSSSSCLIASRRARCSAHWRPGVDFTTRRRVTPSARTDSTPSTAGPLEHVGPVVRLFA